MLVCAFVIEKGSGKMLDLIVQKDGKIKKTYLFSGDTTFKVSVLKDGMLRKGTLLVLFMVGEEVYSVPNVQNGGVYKMQIFFKEKALCRGVYTKCKGRKCKKIFEIKINQQ